MVTKAQTIHKTSPVVTVALGRTLTAGAIMGAMLKNETDLLTINIKATGPIGGIVVTSNRIAQTKGYVHNNTIPHIKNQKQNVANIVGGGILTVTKDIALKEPISGQTPLVSGEIAEDITYYYAKSEQIPSCVALGVLVNGTVITSGGFILQLLPHAKEDLITHIEKTIQTLPQITTMLAQNHDIVTTLFPCHKIHEHSSIEPTYHCDCTREKTKKALMSITKKELHTIIKEDGFINVHCHFCKKDYRFDSI